jgi:hypothetical protein
MAQNSPNCDQVAGGIRQSIAAEEGKSKYFFRRRVPRLRGIKRNWVRPSDPDCYGVMLQKEGFISTSLLGSVATDELKTDCQQLEEHLLPSFWKVDQMARFYQNRYYLYQWVFILSAFITTALAATNVLSHDSRIGVSGDVLNAVLGVLTALTSGAATAVAFLNANESPHRRWFTARTQAESLRSLYFTFLARQKPFDSAEAIDRVQSLRVKVLDVLRETDNEGGGGE